MKTKLDKYEIRHQALLEAIRFCGGVAAYSDCIKVSRTRASNWRNQPEISIPYEYVVLTEDVTRVSIERLSPFTEAANKALRRLRAVDKLPPIYMLLNEIAIDDYLPYKKINQDRPIIIGTDRVLISGLAQLESQKSIKMKKAIVTVLDLESLLLGMGSIKDMKASFLISEQVAMGLRLEQLINKYQGKRDSVNRCIYGEINNNTELRPIWDEVNEKHGKKIAHITGLIDRENYWLARQVYFRGISELIDSLDQEQISMEMAAKIAMMPKNSQGKYLQKNGVCMVTAT